MLLAFLVIMPLFIQAQDWVMDVDGKVFVQGQKVAGAVVTLFRNGQQIQQVVTTNNGRFSFSLPPNGEFIIAVTKPGYITKKFKIVTANVPPDRAQAGQFNPFEPDVTLFEMPTSPEISKRVEAILSQPIAIYQYIPAENNFNYDEKYTEAIQSKLAELAELQKQAEKEMQEKAKNAALEAQKQLEIDNKYKAAIAKGDKALAAADYATAKAGYTEALAVKPQEAYPKSKLADIDKLLANANAAKELEAKYKAAIAKGDGAMGSKDYAAAKTAYTEASGLKPAEVYPKQKISEIDKLMADAAKQKELDSKYQAAIAKGDASFNSKDYTSAKSAFTEASGLKPAETYPKTKLAEIDKLLADASKQKELDAKYQAAIAKGDAAMGTKDYAGAKSAYTEALGVKPSETYPKNKLAEIDKLIADAANAAKQKEIDDKYKAALAKADASFNGKDYAAARTSYTEASGIKPAESYPKTRIAEIDKLLGDAAKQKELDAQYQAAIVKADAAFNSKDYTTARKSYGDASGIKPAEAYPKSRMEEIDKLLSAAEAEKLKEQQYKDAIAKGDAGFNSKDYAASKAAYQNALSIKPAELYPRNRIAEIDKLLADMAKAGALDKKYNDLIAAADAAFAQKDYSGARATYQSASALKSSEAHPKNRIAEIDKILADLASQKSAAELDQKYKDAIAKGDKAFAAKDYASARTAYTEATGLKSGEIYPKNKLAEIDKILSAAASQKEIDEKYKAAIAKGDAAFSSKNYTAAQTAYLDASGLKPAEIYPKNKLAEIDKILAANEQATQKEQRYKELIAMGDQQFNAKDYSSAKASYTQALGIKSDAYPKGRIAEIDKLMKDQQASAEAQELNQKYNTAIARGDMAMKEKSFSNARASYNEALTYKPNEKYPKDKLAEIDQQEKAIAQAAADKANQLKYNKAIERADQLFGRKEYQDARLTYKEALTYKPSEKYPADKIRQIDGILNPVKNTTQAKNNTTPVQTEEEKKKIYQSELRSKYPTGVTEEEYVEGGKTILRRVVIRDDYAGVYTKVTHNWGGIYCFKDGIPITEVMFENESR